MALSTNAAAVPVYSTQDDVTLKMPAFEWIHVLFTLQKMVSGLSLPDICNSAVFNAVHRLLKQRGQPFVFTEHHGAGRLRERCGKR